MGNETSLQDGIPEDLEEQARAPPSVAHPPPPGMGHHIGAGGPGSNPGTPLTTTRLGGPRPAARMIGAVFGKGNRNHGNNNVQNHNSQNASGYEYDEKSRTSVTNSGFYHSAESGSAGSLSASEYYPSAYHANGNSLAGTSAQTGAYPDVLSHGYYAQQQQQQTHPYYAQQAAADQAHYYGAAAQSSSAPYSQPLSSADSSHEHPVVGVMYEKATPPKKSLFPGRATARGAALISSMRNLSIAGALRGNQSKKEVNDWEKQWDADDDDSDDGEDEAGGNSARPMDQPSASASNGLPLHQLRPAMDMGHSELPGHQISLGPPHAAAAAIQNNQFDQFSLATPTASSHVPQHLDPFNAKNASDIAQHQHQRSPQIQGIQTATSTPQFMTPESAPPHPDFLSDPLKDSSDDSLEWDSALIRQDNGVESAPLAAKPNVQMFLPMLRVLGKGSFGKVVLVQKRVGKERGALFAMKILRKTHLVKRRQIERTRTERKVLSVVNHPFIMKLHYAFQTPEKLYLVLDYCPGGELFFHLSRFRRFPERVARFYAAELLLAIGHLHKRGIIYRDLKPENVLLDADGHVKLGDFGLAKAGIKHPCEGASSMCGTPEYMAPEVLAQAGHGFCVDYWGLGMLLYEMMTGLPPWYTTDRAKLFRRLKSAPLDIPTYFSAQAANCVSALLERNPQRRLGVTGIRTAMEHHFFRNISWKSLYARRVEAPIRPCEGWQPPEAVQEDPRLAMGDGALSLAEIESNDLDAATANFDNTFTRMPVESDDHDDGIDDTEAEQLNEETFVGFSFDSKDRDAPGHSVASSTGSLSTAAPTRARSYGVD